MANVLIVDDEIGYRDKLKVNLERDGLQVFVAATGREAIRILNQEPIDLVIADIMLPNGVDGLELVEVTRRHQPDLAFLVITGYGSLEHQSRSQSLGAVGYLEKPFDLQVLRKFIHDYFDRRGLLREIHRLEQDLAAAKEETAEAVPPRDAASDHQVDDLWFKIFDRLSRKPSSGPGDSPPPPGEG